MQAFLARLNRELVQDLSGRQEGSFADVAAIWRGESMPALAPDIFLNEGRRPFPPRNLIPIPMAHTYSVQFRISGKSLDPSEITRGLGLQPNLVRVAGERRSTSKVWEKSLLSYDGAADPLAPAKEWVSLEDGLLYVLDRLLPKKDLISAYAASFDAIWWCGHFQSSFDGGPTLSVPLLQRLADFGVPVFIDSYFGDDGS